MKKLIVILACLFLFGCATVGPLPVAETQAIPEVTISNESAFSFLSELFKSTIKYLPNAF